MRPCAGRCAVLVRISSVGSALFFGARSRGAAARTQRSSDSATAGSATARLLALLHARVVIVAYIILRFESVVRTRAHRVRVRYTIKDSAANGINDLRINLACEENNKTSAVNNVV